MRPKRGGVGSRRRMTHREKQTAGKPIGNAPRNFSDAECAVWNALKADPEIEPWVDFTHRRWLSKLARTTAARDAAAEFLMARFDEMHERGMSGEPVAGWTHAFVADDLTTPHPRKVECDALELEIKDLMKVGEKLRAEVEYDDGRAAKSMTKEERELDAIQESFFR